MSIQNLEVPKAALRAACVKWKIRRLDLFGSVRTGRFQPTSDIDLLAEFEPDESWSLMDLVKAEEDFSELFGRRVDLVDRKSLEQSENWIRREAIPNSTEVVYVE